ncbi:hypothetical protein [Actinoplanes sp. NPDC051851]|uniref:hypothetical protein n=1 Tax=Actinoplanes sp. NPDC051851 TaxID=3154753 RepID=UPI003442E1BB
MRLPLDLDGEGVRHAESQRAEEHGREERMVSPADRGQCGGTGHQGQPADRSDTSFPSLLHNL